MSKISQIEAYNLLYNYDFICISETYFDSSILKDFNARYSTWWKDDKTTTEGTHLEALTPLHKFGQLISQPIHILSNSSSCIDLIFTNQPNLVVNCGTHFTLNAKCHHQITYCKLNLSIKFPRQYEWLVWSYKKSNTENIRNSLESVNWKALFKTKTVNKQVSIVNETIINIFSTLFPTNM